MIRSRNIPYTILFGLWAALSFQSACTTTDGPFEKVAVQKELTKNTEGLKEVRSFTFGSCNKQYLPQPLWKSIIAESPDLFLWTGDVVYADTEDMGKLSQVYASQLKQPEYETFLNAGIPVLGTWDDHDYGQNNGDRSYGPKKESQALFLDFIGEKENSPRRKQEGIYAAYAFGSGKNELRFLLLDTRYHRTHPKGGKDADILGDAQWAWLEQELQKPNEGVTFLVSSIQVLAKEQTFEKWLNFEKSYKRLLTALEKAPAKNVVIISGDRHLSELSRQTVGSKEIWEITASGMTHSFRNPDEARNSNSLRVGPVMDRLNFGKITREETALRIEIKDLNRISVINQRILLK